MTSLDPVALERLVFDDATEKTTNRLGTRSNTPIETGQRDDDASDDEPAVI